MGLSVSVEGSNYVHGDAIVWEASRHTMMLQGGGSHIEAHGYSLITTVSHGESWKMTSFHQLSVIVRSVMLCGKIIAMILCYDTIISAGSCPTWLPRWVFSQRLSSTPVELSTTSYHLHEEINIVVGGHHNFWQNLSRDFNDMTEKLQLEKTAETQIKFLSPCHCCCCYLALCVKGFVALAAAADVDPWQSKQFEIEEHWIVAVSSLCHRAEAHQTAALPFHGSTSPTDQMDIYKLKSKKA